MYDNVFLSSLSLSLSLSLWECPSGVMVKALDCGIVISEFELLYRNYVHFRINTLILPAMG